MTPLVSVIVPVYNASLYLRECIDSVLQQEYNNIEVIIVNDGSSDNSLEICQEYLYDLRISIYDVANGGVSKARNIGLANAKGEYVVFVDSDDCVSSDYISSMVNGIINNPMSCICCNYTRNRSELSSKDNANSYIVIKRDAVECVLYDDHIGGYVYNKLFKRGILKTNNISFDERICLYEDLIFVLEYFRFVDSIVFIPNNLYFYRNTDGSLSKVKKTLNEKVLSSLWGLENLVLFFERESRGKDDLLYKASQRLLDMSVVYYAKLNFSSLPKNVINIWKNRILGFVSKYRHNISDSLHSSFLHRIVFKYLVYKSIVEGNRNENNRINYNKR